MVFTPSPILTIAIEAQPDGSPEIHLHGGGQGIWIARMLATLGPQVKLCAPIGGEAGEVLRGLIERDGLQIAEVHISAPNGSYVHDRREGEREEIANVAPPVLHRHELDQLCNLALIEGLESDIAVLGGPDDERVLAPSHYRRMASDLNEAGTDVIVNLSGRYLSEAVAGNVLLAKVSHEDLIADGRAASGEPDDLRVAIDKLAAEGARNVVVSRARRPTIALVEGQYVEVHAPSFERVDDRGAGDSMTAGIAAALARDASLTDALRLGAAAGALNATRRGSATGDRDLIERLAEQVDVRGM